MLIVNREKYNLESFIDRFENSSEDYLRDICKILIQWSDDSDSMRLTTSGSTSTPKKITLPKLSMKTSALRTQDYFGYKSNDVALLCLPVKYIGGMMMLLRSLVSQLNLYIVKPSLNPLDQIDSKVNFAPMTPAQLSVSLEKSYPKIENIDKILLGGGPVNTELRNQISKLKPKVYHSFGMTETISHIAIRELNHQTKADSFHALKGVQLSVDDHSCLKINADYLNDTTVTNDVVELISSDQFRWIGRRDNVIISGGIKLYPEMIEHKLSNVISEEFFITAIDDDLLGQKVCLIMETDETIDLESLLDNISKHIDKYEIPKIVYSVAQFDRTETGKIIRNTTLDKAIVEHKESIV